MGNDRPGWRRIEVDGTSHQWRVGRARYHHTLGTLPVVIRVGSGPRATVHVTCRDIWDDVPRGRRFDPEFHTPVTPALVRQLIIPLTVRGENIRPDSHFRWVDDQLVDVTRECTVLLGDRLFGTVDRIEDFGLFVDLGTMHAVLLLSDLSWSRIRHPSEIAGVGDEVEFVVVHLVDPPQENVRIRGSIRDLTTDPVTLEQEA